MTSEVIAWPIFFSSCFCRSAYSSAPPSTSSDTRPGFVRGFSFPSHRPQSGPGSPQSWRGSRMYSRHRLRPSCGVFARPGHGHRGRGTRQRISAPRTTRVQALQRDLLLSLSSTTPRAFHALCVRSHASCDVVRRFALRYMQPRRPGGTTGGAGQRGSPDRAIFGFGSGLFFIRFLGGFPTDSRSGS